ncbi:MAG: hypothetical protein Q8P91_02800 [bacterium]|nr:hypothetical protein [bacterium]
MQLVRTTLRIEKSLKDQAEKMALEKKLSLQTIFNNALYEYMVKKAKAKAKKIVFLTHNLGAKLDNLTRNDFYD